MQKHYPVDISRLSFIATQAALSAGDLLKKGFGTHFEIIEKPGKLNYVTEYDKACEKLILHSIREEFPDHAFLAEESGAIGMDVMAESQIIWLIDPLDGTLNFANNIPFFAVSIAAMQAEQVLCAVINYPLMGELFVAEKDKGAYLNGNQIKVTEVATVDDAFTLTGFPYNHQKPPKTNDHFSAMTRLGIPNRALGSAALSLAYVAAGRADAYWMVNLHPWDVAAGKLLVEEAGGKVTHYDGSAHMIYTRHNVLATNSIIHHEMTERLTSA